MGWQRWAADGLLEVDGPGQFRNRIGLISVARQNGKSTLMVGLIGWAMTEGAILRGGPQTVVLTANTLDTASLMFKQVEPILVERFGGKSYKSFGRQEVELANGSVLIARAASESIGHGRSVDLAVVDEVWQVPAEAINAGLLPAQRARWNPMLAMFSTAGTAKSEAMIGWREKGLAAIQGGTPSGLYMAEWSLGEADPEDRSAWHLANPALLEDRLPISIEAMELERQTYDWGEFCRASLNLWVANDNPWLRTGTWEQLSVDDELPAPQVIALEASAEDSRFSAVAAGRLPDGRTMVWVAFMVGNDADAWQKIRDLAAPNTVIAVPGSLEIRIPPDLRRRSTIVGYAEINRWTKGVTFDIYNAKVVHRGDVALSDHVARAVAVVHNGDPALSSKRSTGSIALARCMVWAVTLARRPVATGRPTVATSRR
jgi:phage terminase large subunit-like protein